MIKWRKNCRPDYDYCTTDWEGVEERCTVTAIGLCVPLTTSKKNTKTDCIPGGTPSNSMIIVLPTWAVNEESDDLRCRKPETEKNTFWLDNNQLSHFTQSFLFALWFDLIFNVFCLFLSLVWITHRLCTCNMHNKSDKWIQAPHHATLRWALNTCNMYGKTDKYKPLTALICAKPWAMTGWKPQPLVQTLNTTPSTHHTTLLQRKKR